MDIQMTISAYCGSIAPKPSSGNMSNIIDYCRYESQHKALSQKGQKQFNTSGNDTQISKAMRTSQLIRSKKSSTYNINRETGTINGTTINIKKWCGENT